MHSYKIVYTLKIRDLVWKILVSLDPIAVIQKDLPKRCLVARFICLKYSQINKLKQMIEGQVKILILFKNIRFRMIWKSKLLLKTYSFNNYLTNICKKVVRKLQEYIQPYRTFF